MKLVGATDSFIRLPFLLEGILLGALGAVVASSALWYAYDRVAETTIRTLPFLPILGRQPLLNRIALALVVTGAGMGAAGSAVSLRRYLRV